MRATDIGHLCFERPIYLSGKSAWAGLIPLAFTLIEKLRPSIFVELGTHYGDSYLAFCQAIQKAGVNCRAYAVDTWQGDEHAGFYGENVLNMVRSRHDVAYSSFSTLLRQTFDEAASHFSPKTVDLLHIDGLHTYEAVKHDFDTWLPLLSDKAVVVFHDINVHERDFGVWKLFDELSLQYPTFRFDHSHGLGIAAVGKQIPEEIKYLFELTESEIMPLKGFYAALGFSITHERNLSDALHVQNAAVADSQEKIASLTAQLADEQRRCADQQSHLESALADSAAKDEALLGLQSQLSVLNQELASKNSELHSVLNSRSWRMAALAHRQVRGARKARAVARKLVIAKNRVGGWGKLYARAAATFRAGGFASLKAAMAVHLNPDAQNNYVAPLDILKERERATFAEVAERFVQSPSKVAGGAVKISLIMPVYKVPEHFLSLAIDSVIRQSYSNWELCIADDCSESEALTALLKRYAELDDRIKFCTLEENSGIAAASNRALALASGEYVALLDNDDVLTNDALYWLADAIQHNPSLDWIYSDECKVDASGNILEIFTKPDWSPSLLLNCMYTGHLSAYRKTLVDELGGFKSEFDFSQDYDLALRVSEKTDRIQHVERVLYGWRAIETSGAAGGKPYARESNVRALQAAAERRGWEGKAIALPTANRFKFDLASSESTVSIVIPSDNPKNIADSIRSVRDNTTWKHYEIIVVTNSGIVDTLSKDYLESDVRFVRYDLPYSFSDKCNKGAEAANGEFIVFFNDDVRVQSADWIEAIVEYLQLPGVGIVGPKLVYENNTIQHAGMVTGVRRLLGTAFHSLPEDTGAHYNFAQSVREVSLICGACLGIRKDIFEKIEGFDSVNAPINHSDVDLCLKVRELGYACVYTPHATLTHIGHMSLATVDAKEKISAPKKKDKADIFILRRWASFIARDPFFTKPMREQLYHDSPEHYEFFAPLHDLASSGKDVLLVSHDLTESGAPRVVYELAKTLVKAGHFVVVASPSDGPIRKSLQELGVAVIVDELLLSQHASVFDFARNFDALICNTVVTYPLVLQLSQTVDTYWYIHETSLFSHLASSNPDFVEALKMPKQLWAGSKLAAGPIKSHNPATEVLEYGFPALERVTGAVLDRQSDKLMIRTFGSYEPRKGQDLLVRAIKALPRDVAARCEFEFYGRTLDSTFFDNLTEAAKGTPNISLMGDVDYTKYAELVSGCDLVVVPSRDDTLPLVSLHALSIGKPLLCSLKTGTSAYLDHQRSGYVFPDIDPLKMAQALAEVVGSSDKWEDVGASGKAVFDQCFSEARFSKKLLSKLNFN